jgi:hypothetical protein
MQGKNTVYTGKVALAYQLAKIYYEQNRRENMIPLHWWNH